MTVSASGCVIGPIAGLFTGSKSDTIEVPAAYTLPAGRLLILVDSRAGVAEASGVRPILTRELVSEIRHHKLAAEIIPTQELSMLRAGTQGFEQMDIASIGREVGAKQVLYAEVTAFSLGTLVDKPAGQGVITARVKVFDVQENRRVWPETEPLGREIVVRTGFREETGKDYQQDFTEDLCYQMAVDIVKLFRKHTEPRMPGENPVETN